MTYEQPPSNKSGKVFTGLIVAVVVLVLAIAGITVYAIASSNDDPTPSPTTPSERPTIPDGPTAPPATIPPSVENPSGYTDNDYVIAIERELGVDFDDNKLIQLGHNICDALDEYGVEVYSASLDEVATQVGVTVRQLLIITEAAVITYCPEYSGD